MPAPTTHTSARVSSASAGSAGVSAVAIQTDVVSPESLFKVTLPGSGARAGGGARLRGVLRPFGAALRLDRDAVDVDHLAAEPAGDRDQDDAEHGEQERDRRAPADPARAAGGAQVEVRDEDDERDDVEARVPVGELLDSAVRDREPVDDAGHGGHGRPDDAAQQRVEGD